MRIGATVLVLLLIGALLFIWFGAFNVSATERHNDLTLWLISFVRDRSIAVRASAPQPMPSLINPELVKNGFRRYHSMCVTCHSAPGRKPNPVRRGLNPKPPKLDSQRVQRRSNTELYWIIEHGIRMTGMPAFGPTHRPEAIWALVGFIRQLPNITPQQYQDMVQAAELTVDQAETEEEGHEE
jgi:mono/diheme cytochrome c family protein